MMSDWQYQDDVCLLTFCAIYADCYSIKVEGSLLQNKPFLKLRLWGIVGNMLPIVERKTN